MSLRSDVSNIQVEIDGKKVSWEEFTPDTEEEQTERKERERRYRY